MLDQTSYGVRLSELRIVGQSLETYNFKNFHKLIGIYLRVLHYLNDEIVPKLEKIQIFHLGPHSLRVFAG
jgi:hypothetical protein